jgi:mannose-1-phosphate guanylyltransferase
VNNDQVSFDDVFVVVLAGGAGTRFWPASTAKVPKQLLRFFGDRSLLQQSVDRVQALVPPERTFVITSAVFVDAVRAQLPELPEAQIVGEPARKDTAAAVVLAALLVARAAKERGVSDARMVILTADHRIDPDAAFHADLRTAIAVTHTHNDALVTFGVPPTYAATGFGYIELGGAVGDKDRPVRRFVEKPDQDRAAQYLAQAQRDGSFVWNSGMFIWRAQALLTAASARLPGHLAVLEPAVAAGGDAWAAAFSAIEQRVSIDVGVMEGAAGAGLVRCVPATFSWSDVGSFPALADHLDKDDAGNVARGRLAARDAKDNVVFCTDDRERVALIGVQGLVVVRAGTRTLVVPKDRAEEIKLLVASLPPDEQ